MITKKVGESKVVLSFAVMNKFKCFRQTGDESSGIIVGGLGAVTCLQTGLNQRRVSGGRNSSLASWICDDFL